MTGIGGPHDSEDKKKGFLGARLTEGKMSSYQPSRKVATEQLLANLSAQGGQAGAGHALDADPKTTMVGWVDHLFDCLAACEYEWNRTIERPDMKVVVERPENTSREPGSGGRQVLKGRLSMHGWSMFVRATPDLVESYVMPSDRAISFTVNPGQFSRLIQINAEERNGLLVWFLGNRPVDWEELSDLAKELLEALIKIASGEANLEEEFTFLRSNQPAVAAPPPQSSAPPSIAPSQGSQARQHSAILGGLDSPLSGQPAVPSSSPPSHRQVILPSASPAQPIAPPPAASQPAAAPAANESARTVPTHPALAGQPSAELLKPAQTESAPKEATLDSGYDFIIAALDREVRTLSDEGARAFGNQDTDAAERVLKRTGKLKALRAEMVSTFLRWKATYND